MNIDNMLDYVGGESALEENPELKEFCDFVLKIKMHKYIPEYFPEKYLNNIAFRHMYTRNVSFAVVDKSWTVPLAKWMESQVPGRDVHVLEILAGTGYLAQALEINNIKVTAVDNLSWQNKNIPEWEDHFHSIIDMDAVKAIEKYGKEMDFIIMSWPPLNDSIAKDCLNKIRQVNPNCKIIYIGEFYGGCCANDDFFENIKEYIDLPSEIRCNFKQWDCIHDEIIMIK